MSESIATLILFGVGVTILCFASVLLAVRGKGDRSITWSGFGVQFRVAPCSTCQFAQIRHQHDGADSEGAM